MCTKASVAALQGRGLPSGTTQCLWTVYFTWDESKHLKCTHSAEGKKKRTFNFLKMLYNNAEQLYIANAFKI